MRDGRTEVVVYEDAASLEEGLPQLARQEGCGAGPAQLHIHKHRSLHHRPAAGGAVGPV